MYVHTQLPKPQQKFKKKCPTHHLVSHNLIIASKKKKQKIIESELSKNWDQGERERERDQRPNTKIEWRKKVKYKVKEP